MTSWRLTLDVVGDSGGHPGVVQVLRQVADVDGHPALRVAAQGSLGEALALEEALDQPRGPTLSLVAPGALCALGSRRALDSPPYAVT